VRSRKADLRRRVNGKVEFRSGRQEVTSRAGLELFREYLSSSGFVGALRRAVGASFPGTDFGAVAMVLTLLGLILVGGRRVLHLEREHGDPVMARFAGLDRLPSARTVSYWLQLLRKEHVDRLAQVHHELVGKVLRRSGSRRLTLDIDGSVVSAGARVEGARRGYNPRRRGARSYWPITAYEAQEGQIVRLMNRPGNVHDGAAAVDFIAALVEQVRAAVGRRRKLECRMDSAFFREDVLQVLDKASVEYAVKVPFLPWLGLKQRAAQAAWKRIDDRTSYSEVRIT